MIPRPVDVASAPAVCSGAALALEVSEGVVAPGGPAAVWAELGAFRAVADWHPVATSREVDDTGGATVRTPALDGGGGGGEPVEERTSRGETSRGRAILGGSLPTAGRSSASAGGGGPTIARSSAFEAAGAADAEAEAVIRGTCRAALDAAAAPAG